MAVAEGGYLTQHLPDVTDVSHRFQRGTFTEHGATFTPGSLAASLLGPEMVVNSSHHQAVADPGRLTVTGRAEDGTIEVCEASDDDFTIGVQWHPEHGGDVRLFQALIDAATG